MKPIGHQVLNTGRIFLKEFLPSNTVFPSHICDTFLMKKDQSHECFKKQLKCVL